MLDEQKKAEKPAVFVEQLAKSPDHGRDLAPGATLCGGKPFEPSGIVLEAAAEERPDQFVLAGVVAIEGAIGEADRGGNVADARLGHALVHEELEGSGLDPTFGVLAHGACVCK